MPIFRVSPAWMFVVAVASICSAQHPIPESERWATITHPGNEAFVWDPPGVVTMRSAGRVDYEYQIGRTEVTGAEWFEFVQAYAPFVHPGDAYDAQFTSTFVSIGDQGQYVLSPLGGTRGVEVGFRYAARYVNWLHNDKRLDQAAFENGAYDTSTFGFVPGDDGGFTDQQSHSPGARYWIPTQDEWLKAAHFDPDRHGPGMPGYWLYSHSSDSPPAFGSPENGGNTSTGGRIAFQLPEVGAYRDVQSPWGLWDASGGFQEWSEGRHIQGSSWRDSYSLSIIDGLDRIDDLKATSAPQNLFAFRLARAVPSPGWAGVLSCAVLFNTRKRRRNDDSPVLT